MNLYDREERMKLLKEHDDLDWQKMKEDYNSSEEEDSVENYGWYNYADKNTYFTLCTKHKNIIDKDQQIFHCYGRRTNRFLLSNYGFCLEQNKYNSLTFRVWLDFNEGKMDRAANDDSEDDNRI